MASLKRFVALLVLTLAWPLAGWAASVRPLDLDNLVDNAATVFQGQCLESRSERDEATGAVVTIVTFQVQDTLKGEAVPLRTIKQLGGRIDGEVSRIDGMPTFTPGEEYLVFLYGVSQAGFSSPVGLAQGRFPVKHEAKGRVVGNGRDLRDVLPAAARANMPESVQKRLDGEGELTHMDLEEFKELVRERVRR